MTIVRCQVELGMDSGVPNDAVVNSLYFRTGNPDVFSNETDAIGDAVEAIYDGLAAFMASVIDQNNLQMTYYNMNDLQPRTPIATETRNVSTTDTTTLPAEVALCMSFKADPQSGVNPASLRGRIYLGPWGHSANNGSSGRPQGTVVGGVAIAGAGLRDAPSLATAGIQWVVYSPTLRGAGPAEDGANDVVTGHCDNAWDSQRRRGVSPATRTVFP